MKGIKAISILSVMIALSSCTDNFLPESLDAFDKDASFSTTVYRPVLGRNNVISDNFNAGNSTMPLHFTLQNVRKADGTPAPELTDVFPVKVWTSPYLGTEKTLEEIEAKRGYEYRSLFQVREYSGEIVLWSNALSSFVDCAPSDGYLFDVKAENSGGYKIYSDLMLIPQRERDYEPNNFDESTGFITDDFVHPTTVTNVYREQGSGFSLTEDDINIYFRRSYENDERNNTLTFRFMKSDFTPIDPKRFNQTDWNNLVHGFNKEITSEYVRYNVAYPIPLNDVQTQYTTKSGDMAHVSFRWDVIYRGQYRLLSQLDFDFSIFKEGDWEIIIVFANGNPAMEIPE